MYRIDDYYGWKKLKHWKRAIEMNIVGIKIVEKKEIPDDMMDSAISLLENDCFPISIICCRGEGNQKEIWMTALWFEIFEFLNNKRTLKKEGKEMWFEKMEDDKQKAILNAQISTIWLAE